MDAETTSTIIKEYQTKEGDTASPEVQVALLTSRIIYLTEHLKYHHKDHATRRGLLMMVSKRRKLLKSLQRKSNHRYLDLIAKLGLRR